MNPTSIQFLMGFTLAGAYLVGSIPFGLVIARLLAGKDVRQTGSGNIGATNVFRSVGVGAGVATMALDTAKGAGPVLFAQWFFGSSELAAWTGLAAVCGHMFSVFLRLEGGKGVATGLGVFLVLAPGAVGVATVVFLILVLLTRMVSLGSVLAAVTLPCMAIGRAYPQSTIYCSVVVAILVVVKHHQNIQRLLAGTESRLWGKDKKAGEEL